VSRAELDKTNHKQYTREWQKAIIHNLKIL